MENPRNSFVLGESKPQQGNSRFVWTRSAGNGIDDKRLADKYVWPRFSSCKVNENAALKWSEVAIHGLSTASGILLLRLKLLDIAVTNVPVVS